MWRNEPLLYLICGKLILETQAVIHPPARVFRLRFILCQRGTELGGQMCQLTASLRPLSQKSYDGEEASRGRIHSCFWRQDAPQADISKEADFQEQFQRYNKVK